MNKAKPLGRGDGGLGDDFEGVAVGIGDGGEEGAGGGALRLTEDGHAGGCKALDEGTDGVFAANGKCEVCVSAGWGTGLSAGRGGGSLAGLGIGLSERWNDRPVGGLGLLHQFDACTSVGRVHECDACAGRAGDFGFGFHAEVCAVESS